jgi:hypothetical protein
MKTILVAGDVCLDVVGIAVPPPPSVDGIDNWRLTGETRTHFLLGGALQLAEWLRVAGEHDVRSPRPLRPAGLGCKTSEDHELSPQQFLNVANRLTREEVVHSLLSLDYFAAKPKDEESNCIRVQHTHGFSGPQGKDPSMKVLPPNPPAEPADFIVLDDTGNRFRREPDQWPDAIKCIDTRGETVVVYKLHRPLPANRLPPKSEEAPASVSGERPILWDTVSKNFPKRRIVIISIDDLRKQDAPISYGLSWEQTALDLVWHLLNMEAFALLRDCPNLIVRMGLDGALYWHSLNDEKRTYHAWLIYDPTGIEGVAERSVEGTMVGYGSTFTAALVNRLADANEDCLAPITKKVKVRDKDTGEEKEEDRIDKPSSHIVAGIMRGLIASRRLLKLGFGMRGAVQPNYPASELFQNNEKDPFFACQPVPVIRYAVKPDRGYWRLLESIFQGEAALLHRAVALVATKAPEEADKDEDRPARELLKQVPTAVFAKKLRTWDRREIENYRALYGLILDYIKLTVAPRPLNVAVFGPPGAGKSFGVKQVAKALSDLDVPRPIESLTFNLSQYQNPDELASAFHLVRDVVLRGKIPLVFVDEFDTTLSNVPLGWLRYFLAPMQDGEFLDRGTPHPIGQSIFVFAGGTSNTYAKFAEPFFNNAADGKPFQAFKSAKGPDFLSRLRGTLDVPGLDLDTPFDAYGPVDAFPCEAAILLRRAGILAHQLEEKAPRLCDSTKALRISRTVLRALLHLPKFEHGNRSLEALLDMSHLPDASQFTPALLPCPAQTSLHANSLYLSQLLATEYPYPPQDRERIAQTAHEKYAAFRIQTEQNDPDFDPNDRSLRVWDRLDEDLKESNRQQADHIPDKLHKVGLWFRNAIHKTTALDDSRRLLDPHIEALSRAEHDRWIAEKRRQGWIAARDTDRNNRDNNLRLHNNLFSWDELPEKAKEYDRVAVRSIPDALASAGYEIYQP